MKQMVYTIRVVGAPSPIAEKLSEDSSLDKFLAEQGISAIVKDMIFKDECEVSTVITFEEGDV